MTVFPILGLSGGLSEEGYNVVFWPVPPYLEKDLSKYDERRMRTLRFTVGSP